MFFLGVPWSLISISPKDSGSLLKGSLFLGKIEFNSIAKFIFNYLFFQFHQHFQERRVSIFLGLF
jgi:hypothetical protein